MVQETHSRPSEIVCLEEKLDAYLFDSAVVTFGTLMENALSERVNVGSKERADYQNKYNLSQLLDPKFHLPNPSKGISASPMSSEEGVGTALALAGQLNSGVKKWVYVGPEPDKT